LIIATSWSGVLLARITDRLGKGIRTAPRDTIIADSAKNNQRGHAFGLHRALDTFGAIIGVTIAFVLIVHNANNFKYIFIISMFPALLGVIALFFIRQPKEFSSKAKSLNFSWSELDTRLKAFLILAFIFNLGNSSNQFLLLRASNLGVSAPVVIMLYLAYNVSYGLLSYPAGRLSDKVGRRKLLVLGYFVYSLVYFAFARVQSQSTLWYLFIVYGVYIAFTEGVEKALLTDIAPSNLRGTVIGLHATLVGIALLPASFIAGTLWEKIGPSSPFYFGSFMGLIASIGLLFILRSHR
jgi:MFS family permease